MTRCRSRFAFSVLCALFISASQANAQMCGLVMDVESDQRTLARALQIAQGSSSDARIERQLLQILDKAYLISQFYIADRVLHDTVINYLDEIQDVRTALRLYGVIPAARVTTTNDFRWSVNSLGTVANRICAEDIDTKTVEDGQSGGVIGAMKNMSWKVVIPVFSIVVIALSGAVYALLRRISLRSKRRERYNCSVPLRLTSGDIEFVTKMIDVSANGAKIAKTDGQNIGDKMILMIGKREYHGALAWQNAHFVGITFARALSIRQVRGWSSGRQDKQVAKDYIPPASAT